MTVHPHAAAAASPAAQGGWQLAGTSAEAYERYLVSAIFASMAERVLDLAGVQPADRVLDVGCGTGIVARRAAPRVGPRGSVTGLDLNADMLKVARAVSDGSIPPIAWHPGDAARLPFEDGSFDAVTCQQALQFFPEPATALREVRRVLSDRGRTAIAVLRAIQHTPVYGPVAAALERHAGPQAGAMMRSPFPSWDREHLRARRVRRRLSRRPDPHGHQLRAIPVGRGSAAARSGQLSTCHRALIARATRVVGAHPRPRIEPGRVPG